MKNDHVINEDIYKRIKLTGSLVLQRRSKGKGRQNKGSIYTLEEQIPTNIKVTILNTNIETVLLYRAETVRATTAIIVRVQLFINNCLCKMVNVC